MAHASPGQHKFAPFIRQGSPANGIRREGQSSVKRRYVLWQNTTRASPLVVLLARVESTIPYPEARIDVSKIIWPSDFLPLCCRSFLRVDRSREEGCSLRIFPPIRPGSRAFLSLLGEPTPRYVSSASSFSSACEDKRTSSKTDRPSRNTTHRGLSSEGRKPGNYYVSRETRGNPDFFFLLPSRILKGSSSHPGETFYAT